MPVLQNPLKNICSNKKQSKHMQFQQEAMQWPIQLEMLDYSDDDTHKWKHGDSTGRHHTGRLLGDH